MIEPQLLSTPWNAVNAMTAIAPAILISSPSGIVAIAGTATYFGVEAAFRI